MPPPVSAASGAGIILSLRALVLTDTRSTAMDLRWRDLKEVELQMKDHPYQQHDRDYVPGPERSAPLVDPVPVLQVTL